MNINLTQPVLNIQGKPFKVRGDNNEETELTLKDVCIGALLGDQYRGQNDPPLSRVVVVRRYNLANAIQKSQSPESFEISTSQATILEDLIPGAWPVAIAGAAISMIDPNAGKE